MSKKIIGFDIGAYNIKAGIWNESLHTEIPSDATLISNDTFQHLTSVSLNVKQDKYQVCDHARCNPKTNLSSYVWNIKGNVGDHQGIVDLEEDIANFRHRPTLKHGDNRAYYNLEVNKEDLPVDAEIAYSLIMEYLYYLGFKNQGELYDDVTAIAQRGVSECEKALFSIPSYYTEANVRGMQVALDAKSLGVAAFVPDYIACCVDYGYHPNRNHEYDASSKTVMFVHMGHTYTSCTLAVYSKDRIDVKSHDYTMLGGIDFTTALYKEIRDYYLEHNKDFEYNTLRATRKEMMEKQFWDWAEKVKNAFALESTDLFEIEIENMFTNDPDSLYTFEITRERVCEIWKDLLERFELFVDAFIRGHSEEKIDSCEIVGGSMRLIDLKNRVTSVLKSIDLPKFSNTMNMDESIARGLAMIGQGLFVDKTMMLNSRDISLQYTVNDVPVHQIIPVWGLGECNSVENMLCISNTMSDLKEGVDHDWNTILSNFQKMDFLRPSVFLSQEGEQKELEALSDSPAPLDSSLPFAGSSRTTLGGKRYSTMPQDDSIILEISGSYTLCSTFENRQNDIIHSGNKKKFGYANTQFNMLDGEFCLFYDEKMEVLKEKCSYVQDKRDGVCMKYYDNEKNSLHSKCEYKMGKRVNQFISYYPNGQIECILFYDEEGVERRRVEFYKNGAIKRAAERDSEDVQMWKMLEFSQGATWICATLATREQKDGQYVYTRSGEGILFGGNRYIMKGTFKGETITVDCKHGVQKVNMNKCVSALKKIDGAEKFELRETMDGESVVSAWEKLKRESKDKKTLVLRLFGKKVVLCEEKVEEENRVTTVRSVLGYPTFSIKKLKQGYIRTDYYPGFSEEVCLEVFNMNVAVPGVFDKPVVAKITEVDESGKVVKEEEFLNTGEKMFFECFNKQGEIEYKTKLIDFV